MKNYKTTILAVIGILSLSACGETNKQKDGAKTVETHSEIKANEQASQNQNTNLDDGDITAKPEFKDEAMAAVYNQYLNVKSALVNSDAAAAQQAGKTLTDTLQNIESAEKAKNAAHKIAESNDLNEQRTAFSDLSAAVENLMTDALVSGGIYKQYCPMAFQGKGGYWLASSEEIRNPYYGSMMLECGSVRDTLQ